MEFKFYLKIYLSLFCLFYFSFPSLVFSQHRGDNFSYQGLSFQNETGVKPLAMGGAYTSISGDINSLFWNPAGLADLSNFQFTISANYYKKTWQENQEYRPNRYFVTLPFYLEGLYIPDPKNNGMWDNDLAQDTNYYVSPPIMGKDPFSKEAADWQNNKSEFSINSAAAAFPLNMDQNTFVISLGYNQKAIADFDRNDTYLNPDLGYTYYAGDISRVSGTDTLNVQWSKYLRSRTGTLYNLTGAIAYQLNEYVLLGARTKIIWGNTTDLQTLTRVGSFDLADQNEFRFSYQNVNNRVSGNSKYNGFEFTLGTVLKLNRFQIGVNINLPYTLKRKWDYSVSYSDSIKSSENNRSGTDKFKIPLSYSFGISFKPIDKFTIAFDYEVDPYKNAEFDLSSNDSTFRPWVSQKLIRIGLEYKPLSFLSLLAGYRDIPQTFVPDGAAIRDSGPDAIAYTFGASIKVLYGRLDLSYEIRRLKYYDSYYSNTNYNLITYNNLLFGYTLSFDDL